MRPTKGQIDDLLAEIKRRGGGPARAGDDARPSACEDLTEYLASWASACTICTADPHHQRVEILRDLRLGVYDVVVGINLLLEGWTCRRCRWWRSSARIRKASCAAKRVDQNIGAAACGGQGGPLCRQDDGCHALAIDETAPCEIRAAQPGERHRAAEHRQEHRPDGPGEGAG